MTGVAAATGGSEVQLHRFHLVLLVVWVAIFGAVYLHEWLRRRTVGRADLTARSRVSAPHELLARVLGLPGAIALTSVVAGAVHLGGIDEQFHEAAPYGWFVVALTIAQVGFAFAVIWRPTRPLLVAGGSASLALVFLWLAARTTGVPFGPAAGQIKPFGLPDIVASVAELGTALLCAKVLLNRAQRREVRALTPLWTPVRLR